MYMMQGTRTVCVSLLQPPGGSKRVEFKNSLAMAFEDKYPVTEGHMPVGPLLHMPSFFLNWVLQNRTEGPCFFLLL